MHPSWSRRASALLCKSLGLNPWLAILLATALSAYTAGSAYLNHSDSAGRIRVGYDADLVVTDRDPFAGAPDQIGYTRTAQTWVRGHRVF